MDKPAGPTSHDVVATVRRALNTRRVGHAGTLDPFATGLLVVLVGKATRLARFFLSLPKVYTGTIRLGQSTTTDDLTGQLLHASQAWLGLTDSEVERALTSLIGRTDQRPPMFSAKSVAGRRAYRRARRGEQFELDPEPIDVYRLDLVSRSGPDLVIHAEVGSGVYLRALARDLGDRLGCGAHLAALRRVAVGPFAAADAIPLGDLAIGPVALRPARDAVAHLPLIRLDEESRVAVRHGRAIPSAGAGTGPVALFAGEELVAVAESDGVVLRPSVVFEAS
ncbi:MAG: tRNA pseudouridine(55) synthase TruB [Gemmatimonadetes bacterium]|nr:tRNA pseudouridine(55) synthase TruB [Gemmatimonadota bacterium]